MDDESWHALLRQLRELSDSLLATKPIAVRSKSSKASSKSPAGAGGVCSSPIARFAAADRGLFGRLADDGGTAWSFEMYRHRPDAIRGVVPHLFHEAMMRMKAEGIDSVSLCLLPGMGCEEAAAGRPRLTRRVAVLREETS